MISNEELGKRLKQFRKSRKVTQEEMAAYCHVSKNHISTLERGIYTCSASTLIAYAEKLNMSLDELVGTSQERQQILPDLKWALSEMTAAQQRQVFDIIQIIKRPV